MNSYRGNTTEKPLGGGKYNENNIGYEVYNYLWYKGNYYGFVEVGINNSIHVERLCGEKADYAENIMVIWVATNPNIIWLWINFIWFKRKYHNFKPIR